MWMTELEMEGNWNLYIYRYIWVAFNSPKGSSPHLLAGDEEAAGTSLSTASSASPMAHPKTWPRASGRRSFALVRVGQRRGGCSSSPTPQREGGPSWELGQLVRLQTKEMGGRRWRHRAYSGYVTAFSLLFSRRHVSSLDLEQGHCGLCREGHAPPHRPLLF